MNDREKDRKIIWNKWNLWECSETKGNAATTTATETMKKKTKPNKMTSSLSGNQTELLNRMNGMNNMRKENKAKFFQHFAMRSSFLFACHAVNFGSVTRLLWDCSRAVFVSLLLARARCVTAFHPVGLYPNLSFQCETFKHAHCTSDEIKVILCVPYRISLSFRMLNSPIRVCIV